MSYYPRIEHETQDPKGLALRMAKGQILSLKRQAKDNIELWKKNPKEHLKQIQDAQEIIAKCDSELADYPDEPKQLVQKRIGQQRVRENVLHPAEALQQDLSTAREDEDEGKEGQSEILNDVLLELRRISNRLDVIVHLLQIDRIYKSSDKRREQQKLLMRKVREKERAEQ